MKNHFRSIGKTGIISVLCWLGSAGWVCAQSPSTEPAAQDTLRIGLDSAESIFVRQNLSVLAQRYNVNANEALVLQARLWPNPNLSLSTIIYNTQAHQFFPFGSNGEITGQLSQLILLAGKRNKQIQLAQAGTKLAEYQLFDLLRTLKYTLRTDFYNIYYMRASASVYDEEISALQKVVDAFNQQQGKGYIAPSEVVRVKAQLYSLQSEYNDLLNQIYDTESELKLVLQVKSQVYVLPLPDTNIVAGMDPGKYPLPSLMDSAFNNRTDLQIAKENTEISRLQYNYQKALAVPDLTLSLGYDQQGSFVNNLTSIGASIDLPFLNRNQGNIKSAKAMVAFNDATQKSTEATVQENVYRAWQKAYANQKLFKNIDPTFSFEFDTLSKAVLQNYERRNIGLLEFLDFYDAYKQNTVQLNTISFNRVSAFEDLNFYTGSNLY
jgi:cobalt-zinc-cadmium efflux system outer membrane protein